MGIESAAAEKKREARKRLKETRDSLPAALRKEKSAAISNNIAAMPQYKRAGTLLCYSAAGSEADMTALMLDALSSGKTVALPRVETEKTAKNGIIRFYTVNSLENLEKGMYNIYEPPCGAQPADISDGESCVCVVPALGFDRSGVRLGFGGGYYDRFLLSFRGVKIGAAFSVSVTDTLPAEAHDAVMDFVVTEDGITV